MKLEIDSLTFGYSESSDTLNNISISIEGPGLVCIVGPNGVGKSTLVKCIAGLIRPKKGIISIDGRDISSISRKELSMVVGYVPPNSQDLFSLPVLDTVMIGRHNIQGWKNTDTDVDAVYKILKLLDIDDLAMKSFNNLSSGQHQRVSLARGLAQETPILLLDEPTANLDIKYQIYVTEMLRAIASKKNMLIVMISHDLNIAAKYAHSIVVMARPGVLYSHGSPEETITENMVKDVYGVNCEVLDLKGIVHVVPGFIIPDRKEA